MKSKSILASLGFLLIALSVRSAVLYVRADASGPETNGLSWVTAFATITQALKSASAGDELWVTAGTYTGAIEVPGDVALLGGFSGNETVRTERDWARNRSVIDWNEWGDLYPFEYQRVGPAVLLARGSRLDGFTVLNGWHPYGAGAYASESGAVIANNIIVTNRSTGIFGSALLVDCRGELDVNDGFFMKTANDLLRLQFPFGITNIPVAAYGVTVHRLLQVAANVYDAARSNTFPSVFRPQFTSTPEGAIISGYYRDDLAATVDAWLSTNPYGIPMIIGARKGFPNFNELAFQTTVLAARKLELRRLTTNSPPHQTNEMYIIGISNSVGMEAWNSYTQAFGHDLEMKIVNVCSYSLRNQDGLAFTANLSSIISSNIAAGSWPGFALPQSPEHPASRASFKVPLLTNSVVLSNSVYRFDPMPHLEGIAATNFFAVNSGFRIPDWQLSISNRLTFVLSSDGRIVDFVFLSFTNSVDLTRSIFTEAGSFGEGVVSECWSTNRPSGPSTIFTPTKGIQRQIDVSLGLIGSPSQWEDYNFDGSDRSAAIDSFRQFSIPLFNNGNTNLVQNAPFIPARKLVISATWEANDPLLHAMAEHLKAITNNFKVTIERPFATGLSTNFSLGRLNSRYAPWGGRPGALVRPEDFDRRLKDSGIWSADDFDFPDGSNVNLIWLDRLHRGTPWQTLYFDSEPASASESNHHSLDPMSHPTNDWKIIKYLRNRLTYSASEAPTRVLNNTLVGNYGSGLWVGASASATVMNNVMAFNTSGFVAEAGEFNRNCTFGNGTQNTGDVSGPPHFVPGGFSLLPTSPLIDAGDDAVLGWIERPVFGEGVDIGALEFGPDAAPVFAFSRSAESGYEFELRGFSGQAYVIEATTNLVDWTAITTNVAVMGTLILQDASGTNYSHRFYRAKVANHPN